MQKKFLLFLVAIVLSASTVFAQNHSSPEGLWRNIDDETNMEKSQILIFRGHDGKLRGKIVRLLNRRPDESQNPLCDQCKGERFNQPVTGMEIMWGFVPADGENGLVWEDGEILDPKNGKVYSCKMTMDANGAAMEVRGFIGFSLIGRSQRWIREK